MTIAGNILQSIANPQIADVAGSMQKGMQATQQMGLNQDKRTALQQQAAIAGNQEERAQQRFTEVSDRNILVEIANDVNTALGLGTGEAQDKVLKQAIAKAPEGSAVSIALNGAISAVGEKKTEILQSINDGAIQQGFLQPTAKASKTADQIAKDLELREAGLGVEKDKLAFQEKKLTEGTNIKQQQVDVSKEKLATKIKRWMTERDALPFGSPDRKVYDDKLKAESQGKTKFSPETIAANVKAVLAGDLSPATVSKRGGLQAEVVRGVRAADSNFNFIQADADAKYLQQAGNLQSRALIKGVQPLYDKLRVKGESLNNSKVKMINVVKNWFKEQAGDADVVAFNNLRDDVVAESERILMGSGVLSDSKYLRAVGNLRTSNSPEQINAAIDQFELVVAERLKAMDALPFGQKNLDSDYELAAESRLRQRTLKARDEGKKKKRRASDNADEEYGEGTEIENDTGEVYILKNGQWVPKGR